VNAKKKIITFSKSQKTAGNSWNIDPAALVQRTKNYFYTQIRHVRCAFVENREIRQKRRPKLKTTISRWIMDLRSFKLSAKMLKRIDRGSTCDRKCEICTRKKVWIKLFVFKKLQLPEIHVIIVIWLKKKNFNQWLTTHKI